jgi:GNAT superfamily N-acetyltransferase
MSRPPALLRDARPDDAPALATVWGGVLRPTDPDAQVADLSTVLDRVTDDPDERVVVAEVDGEVAGAVYLGVTTVTPINLEPVVLTVSPHVLPAFRRHGIGRMLVDAAVTWAEERGVAHVATAASAASRDANRFMARLALAPQAMFRVASTTAVRARLCPQRAGQPSVSQVLAARRSQRRSAGRAELVRSDG